MEEIIETVKEANLEVCNSIKPDLRVRVINQWDNSISTFAPFFDILAETHNLVEVKDNSYDFVLNGWFAPHQPINNKNAIKLYYVGEASPPPINNHDLSLAFDYIDSDNYLRYPLYYLYFKNNISTEYNRGSCNPNKEYFACFLASNNAAYLEGVTERIDTFNLLSTYKNVASGGKTLNNLGYLVPQNETMSFLSKCKFTICYENRANYPGYITEKVFQAYFAGSIPIYRTHSTSLLDINTKAAVIQNLYPTKQAMLDHIIELDQDDKKYCDMWNEKLVIDPNVNFESAQQRLRQKLRKLLKV